MRSLKRHKSNAQYFICVRNEGYEASLERRKIYRAASDKRAASRGLLRIKDESGQFYLYPEDRFVSIKLSTPMLRALALAA